MNIITFFRLAILFEILCGAKAWFTWWTDSTKLYEYGVYIFIAIIAYMYKTKMRIRLSSSPYIIMAVFFYVIGVIFFNRFSLPSLAGVALTLYPMIVLASDKNNIDGHLTFVTKGIAYILILGIILFLGRGFIPPIGTIIQKGSSEDYIFINQFFLIHRIGGFDSDAANRFHSVFLEPGYLGAMLSFMLFALKYDFSKWYNKVLVVALLLSLSLAGYLMTLFGYVVYLITENKSLKNVFLFALLIVGVYYISLSYNGGNNYVNNAIIERLQYDEEKGLAGNNRTGAATDFYFNQAVENGDIWMGLGAERVKQINGGSSDSAGYDDNIRGAGYKVYFVIRGIISALFFLGFYYFMGKACCQKRKVRIGAILFIILIFLPQSTPQSAMWIYPYILAMLNYNQHKLI